jgi:dipeptidyl aminopeptidase/acylaminoacyl peptidase
MGFMIHKAWVTALLVFPIGLQSALAASPEDGSGREAAQVGNAPNQSFTLEQVLDFPYPEETSISSCGARDRIAWVENIHGVRNIVAAEAPQWTKQQLSRYTKDDGQTITELQFTSDCNTIIYLRGGPKNNENEPPNPDGDPAGAEEAIWSIAWSDGEPHKIDDGSAPKVSPKSTSTSGWVGYLKDGKTWIAPIWEGHALKIVTQGVSTDVEWSPDERQIAFVSTRSGHSLIPIYDLNEKTITYVNPTVDRDTYPRWSPAGDFIVFARTPISFGERGSNLRGIDKPNPWAIWVYAVRQKTAREIWHSGSSDNDSLPTLPGNTLLSWGVDHMIVFSSEQDGWQHLYSIGLDGGRPQLLTPGSCEYDYMTYSRDRKTILYSSNCGDIDRRHLWQVSVKGGAPQKVTTGMGLEWWPVSTSNDRWVAYLGSDAQHPAAPYVRTWTSSSPDSGKAQALTQLPADFPGDKLVTPQQVIFKAADGLEIHAQLFLPKDSKPGQKHPAIVHMHGGPQRQLLLGWHPMFYYSSAYAVHQYMVSRGYIVIEVNYRSGIGYGREFRFAKGRGSRGATEYQDIVGAANYLRNRDDVDPSKIGLWGGSYGGFLTAMGLARDSDIFAAGVDFHGVHDWTQRIGLVTGNTVMTGNDSATKIAKESSPIAAISTWRSPVLLIQGDDDRNVDFGQMIELVPMLRERGIVFEQLILPDEVHDFLRWDSWIRADHATVDFFDSKLRSDH